MKVLSIDVGIKNLAFCMFEKTLESTQFKITKWDTVNISEQDTFKCNFIDKTKICNKPAKYKKNFECFCLKHSKKQSFQIPTPDIKPNFIKKQKIQQLFEIANKFNIPYDKPIQKCDLITKINDYAYNNYFQEIATINASKVDLINIGANIKEKFNILFANEETIDYVIIENQISPIANRMKTIQGMIVQYFIMSEVFVDHIEFISASNKLKICNITEKLKYIDRKKLGISKCLEIISSDYNFNDQVDHFCSHQKKDDLSDSFLQGLWFITDRKI